MVPKSAENVTSLLLTFPRQIGKVKAITGFSLDLHEKTKIEIFKNCAHTSSVIRRTNSNFSERNCSN